MNIPAVPKSVSNIILVCAVSLCFAAAAPSTFAQRGGGHGGGGHASGGARGGSLGFRGASGSRVSMGSAGRGGSASFEGRGSSGGVSGGSSTIVFAHGSSTRGYTRNTFVPESAFRQGSASRSRGYFLPAKERSSVATRPFAANNYLWEDPVQRAHPAAPMQAPRPAFAPPMNSMMRPVTPRPMFMPLHSAHPPFAVRAPLEHRQLGVVPHAMRRILTGPPYAGTTPSFHPNGFGPRPCFGIGSPCGFGSPFFNPFFNPFFSNPFFFSPFGFGFGFETSCFIDAFGPCGFGLGPFGGFGPYGLDGDLGYGYDFGNGYFYSPAETPAPPPVNPTESNPGPEYPNYSAEYPFMPAPEQPPVPYSEPATSAPQPVVKLVLKDGTVFGVNSYWLENGRLNYITTYNIRTSIPLDELDLQKTVDMNYKLGITFTLTPQPPSSQQQ